MQPRTPRLDWIAKVLADPDAPPQRADRAPLRLVSGAGPVPAAVGFKPVSMVPALRDRGLAGPLRPHPKAGR